MSLEGAVVRNQAHERFQGEDAVVLARLCGIQMKERADTLGKLP